MNYTLERQFSDSTLPDPRHVGIEKNPVLVDEEDSAIHLLKDISRTRLVAIIVFYVISISIYAYLEGWTVRESMYFLTVTITSVGYGDLHPSGNESRLYTIIVIILGFVLVYPELYSVTLVIVDVMEKKMHIMQAMEDRLKHLMLFNAFIFMYDRYSVNKIRQKCFMAKMTNTDNSMWSDADFLRKSDQYVEEVFQSKLQLYYSILFSIVSMFMFTLMGSLYIWGMEDFSYSEALYLAVASTTTVGYGDLAFQRSSTQVFLIFYLPISVVFCAIAIAEIVNALDKIDRLNNDLDTKTSINPGYANMIQSLCSMEVEEACTPTPRGGSSGNRFVMEHRELTRAEYILEMLKANKTKYLHDVHSEILAWGSQFDTIDLDKSGTLDKDEIEALDKSNLRHTRKMQLSVYKWYERDLWSFANSEFPGMARRLNSPRNAPARRTDSGSSTDSAELGNGATQRALKGTYVSLVEAKEQEEEEEEEEEAAAAAMEAEALANNTEMNAGLRRTVSTPSSDQTELDSFRAATSLSVEVPSTHLRDNSSNTTGISSISSPAVMRTGPVGIHTPNPNTNTSAATRGGLPWGLSSLSVSLGMDRILGLREPPPSSNRALSPKELELII